MDKSKCVQVVKQLLGDDFFTELKKSELGSLGIYKESSKTSLDPEEIKIALQIVPKAVLSFLVHNLKPVPEKGVAKISLPFADATLSVNKISTDVYSGEIYKDGIILNRFKYRSLPGIGLILMSTFELYDIQESTPAPVQPDHAFKLQEIIDERIRLNSLIQSVVDKRLSERDAIQQMINDKIGSHFAEIESQEEQGEEQFEDSESDEFEESEEFSDEPDIEELQVVEESGKDIMSSDKKSKLKSFLEGREKKRQEKVELGKSIDCVDCGSKLYKGLNHIDLCVCYGDFYKTEIKIIKSEGAFKFKFPKSFSTDNVEMLLKSIKVNK